MLGTEQDGAEQCKSSRDRKNAKPNSHDKLSLAKQAGVGQFQHADHCRHLRRGAQGCSPSAPAVYRSTRVVHDLHKSERLTLASSSFSQIVNNSAATKMWTIDHSPSFSFLQPENTHRPATNMQRLQYYDYCNQTFGRARCALVRQTNSHLPTRLSRLDYRRCKPAASPDGRSVDLSQLLKKASTRIK